MPTSIESCRSSQWIYHKHTSKLASLASSNSNSGSTICLFLDISFKKYLHTIQIPITSSDSPGIITLVFVILVLEPHLNIYFHMMISHIEKFDPVDLVGWGGSDGLLLTPGISRQSRLATSSDKPRYYRKGHCADYLEPLPGL